MKDKLLQKGRSLLHAAMLIDYCVETVLLSSTLPLFRMYSIASILKRCLVIEVHKRKGTQQL